MGQFYKDNQAGVDLAGFMISAIVPGSAGVKMLNMGQSSLRGAMGAGKYGSSMGKAFGLLALPNKEQKLAKAIGEVVNGSAAGGVLSRNSLKAMGAGLHQGALESLFFETAVTATMFKSPILENQDFGDFVFNVAFGAGIYGFVSGGVDAIKINRSIKAATDETALVSRPYTSIEEPAAGTTRSSDKLILDYSQQAAIPPVAPLSDPILVNKLTRQAEAKVTKLDNRVRKEYGVLTQGDEKVADALFAGFKGTSIQTKQASLFGLEEVTAFSVKSPKASRAKDLSGKLAKGTQTEAELAEFGASEISTKFMKTWGEGAGDVLDDAPLITSLVDTLGKKEFIKVTNTKVTAGKKSYVFPDPAKKLAKGAKPWNILGADALEANAAYMHAANLDTFAPTAKKPLTIDVDNIPLMEKLLLDLGEDSLEHVKFTGLGEGEAIGSSLQNFLSNKKLEIANLLLEDVVDASGKATMRTQQEIAAVVNVKSSLLDGKILKSSVADFHVDDILALQSHAAKYNDHLVEQGLRKATDTPINITEVPQTLKLTYDSTDFVGLNNFVTENMAIIKQQQKLYQDATNRVVADVLGQSNYDRLQELTSGNVYSGALPSGSGAGYTHAADGNYGTLASKVNDIGKVTADLEGQSAEKIKEILEPLLYKLGANSDATIEWSSLQQRVRSIEGQYGLNKAGTALEPLETIRWREAAEKAVAAGEQPPKQKPLSNPNMETEIPLVTSEVRDLARAHIETNGTRTNGLASLRTAQGVEFNRSPDAFYPIPVDTKDFPFFASVSDESITSGNHHKTLFAATEQELKAQIDKLKENPHLKIRTKAEAEEYFESIGQFSYEKSVSNNYLNTEAHRKGVSAPFLVSTDPAKVTNDMLKWHTARERGLVKETVAAKYEVQFAELLRLGDESTNVATSRFGVGRPSEDLDAIIKNPFADYIKTALNVKKTADYPWWSTPNKLVDQAFTKMWNTVDDLFSKVKQPSDLYAINKQLEKSGYKGAQYDPQMEIFANHKPNSGKLTNVIQRANSIMATVVLRWDALNAVNNAVSANVLLGAETAAVVRAIDRGDKNAAGALAEVARIGVPGTDKTIMSPTKMIARSVKKFMAPDNDMQFYRDNGFITSISKQYSDTLEALAFNPLKDSVDQWGARVDSLPDKLKKAGDFGEVITGNKLAEEFNRFVAADVMKQMTDVAVEAGVMTGKESLAYINTFVNRTQGNYLASQRPMMFSGPVGQAIGLFQTYQFNLLQQMFRHIGEGKGRDVGTMLALQGTIHGMNGLPGFNAVNTHLIGTASGNTQHKDAYSETYGAFGKQAGDWLMYGAASNGMGLIHPDLKVNLYTRGDINPRHITLVPTDPASVPFVQATGKVLANIFNTGSKLLEGGDISTTLLQGLEHNGLSRPLAGLAQTLQGFSNPQQASYSTSKRGNVIAANDLLSLANLGRVLGGKPLDEAIAIDATYRFKSYAALDSKRRNKLGAAIKTTLIAGQDPSQDQIESFALDYAKMGGRQEEFGKWFTQLYKTANVSQANALQQNLKSPFSQSMQAIMGGERLQDFSGTSSTNVQE
jgi:hypothetical protein